MTTFALPFCLGFAACLLVRAAVTRRARSAAASDAPTVAGPERTNDAARAHDDSVDAELVDQAADDALVAAAAEDHGDEPSLAAADDVEDDELALTVDEPIATAPVPVEASAVDEDQLGDVALGVGARLADLASGIEGHALRLCESIGDPAATREAAYYLSKGVHQLRLLSEKLAAFVEPASLEARPLDATESLMRLKAELESYAAHGLKVEVGTALYVPRLEADERALQHALSFLVDAILELQRETSLLRLQANPEVSGRRVVLEIAAETEGSHETADAHGRLDGMSYVAARNLLEAMGGRVAIEGGHGLGLRCVLDLPAAALADAEDGEDGDATESVDTSPPAAAEPEPTDPPPVDPHPFGGVLILENDPSIRSLLSAEFESTGRSICACADGASARALLSAAPDRFELLVLDEDAPIEDGVGLAESALASDRQVKVLVMAGEHSQRLRLESDRVHRIRKPFPLSGLRTAVAELLRTPPAHR